MYAENVWQGETLNRRATTRRIGSLASATRQGLRVCASSLCAPCGGYKAREGGQTRLSTRAHENMCRLSGVDM